MRGRVVTQVAARPQLENESEARLAEEFDQTMAPDEVQGGFSL
jgi:hypothetical protein